MMNELKIKKHTIIQKDNKKINEKWSRENCS